MKKIGVICKDAGSAFFLSRICKKNKSKFKYYLKKPALELFREELGYFKNNDLKFKYNQFNKIIIGTGKTNYEKFYINQFLEKKKLIVFVDHWINLKKRFIYKNKLLLPQEVWVADKKTFQFSKNYFPKTTKIVLLNIKIENKKKSNGNNFLYLMGSLNKDKRDNRLTKKIKENEKKSFDNFLKFLKQNNIDEKKISIKIRTHPEEKNKIYIKKKLSKFKNVNFSDLTLVNEIGLANYIFGANSTAMLIAQKLKKKLIICLDKNKQIYNNYKSFKLVKNFNINEN